MQHVQSQLSDSSELVEQSPIAFIQHLLKACPGIHTQGHVDTPGRLIICSTFSY